jgi:hypothetical protein
MICLANRSLRGKMLFSLSDFYIYWIQWTPNVYSSNKTYLNHFPSFGLRISKILKLSRKNGIARFLHFKQEQLIRYKTALSPYRALCEGGLEEKLCNYSRKFRGWVRRYVLLKALLRFGFYFPNCFPLPKRYSLILPINWNKLILDSKDTGNWTWVTVMPFWFSTRTK